jgi:hypothetical protein
MNETANEDQPEPEISTATDGEETETPLETVEPELPTENLQTSTEVEEAKPDQDV